MSFLKMVLLSVRALVLSRAKLFIELLALRQQLVWCARGASKSMASQKMMATESQ